MLELKSFITDTHQVFYAILAVVFAFLSLRDLEETKQRNSLEKRRFMAALLTALLAGLVWNFYQSWSGDAMFFAVEFAFFITLGLASPKYAGSFFIYLLLTRPWETYPGQLMETMPRDCFYVVALSLMARKLSAKEYYLRMNAGTALAAFFAAWVFLSAFFSPYASEAVGFYFDIFLKGIIVFFILQNCYEKPSDLDAAKAVLTLAIVEIGLISARNTLMLSESAFDGEEGYQRLEAIGILANSNDIAAILVLALPFCVFYFLQRGLRRFAWPLSIVSFFGICALVWSSQSRGALLALAACILAGIVARTVSKKALLCWAAIALVSVAGAFSLLKRGGADLEGSTNNRIIYWMAGANMAVRNPVFGVGFWGFNNNFAAYAVGGDTGTEGKKMTAHSAWVQVLAENGFMGLFLFAGLWGYGLWRSWLIRQEQPEYFSSLVGYGVAISFLSHAYLLYPYILLGLAITQSFLSLENKSPSQGVRA